MGHENSYTLPAGCHGIMSTGNHASQSPMGSRYCHRHGVATYQPHSNSSNTAHKEPPPSHPGPTPWVAARRKGCGPGNRYLPPLPSHGPDSGSQSTAWTSGGRPTAAAISSLSPPPQGGGGVRARTRLPSKIACTVAHPPPLAPAEGARRGAGSSNAAPPCAPGTTSTWGPVRVARGVHAASLPHPTRPRPLRRH